MRIEQLDMRRYFIYKVNRLHRILMLELSRVLPLEGRREREYTV